MNYSLYFERVPKGQKPENEFQYLGPDDLPAWQYWFGEMLYKNDFVLLNKLVDQSDYKVRFINDFLSYHLKYNGNTDQFIICIRSIQEYVKMKSLKKAPMDLNAWKPLYELYNPVIIKWIEQAEKKPRKNKIIETLEDACNGTKEYDSIKAWFIDNKLCDPDTFFWNDKKFTLSCLAGYLKDLNKKGYTHKIKHLDIKAIAKKSFNANMEIDTIKRAKKLPPEIPPYTM